jgi:hypothetical protein
MPKLLLDKYADLWLDREHKLPLPIWRGVL